MPRTMQEILDHADDLAKRFEDYVPWPDDEVDVAEYLLRGWRSHGHGASGRSPTQWARRDERAPLEEDRQRAGHLGPGCTAALRPDHHAKLTAPRHDPPKRARSAPIGRGRFSRNSTTCTSRCSALGTSSPAATISPMRRRYPCSSNDMTPSSFPRSGASADPSRRFRPMRRRKHRRHDTTWPRPGSSRSALCVVGYWLRSTGAEWHPASGTGLYLCAGFAASASAVVPNFNQLLHGNKVYLVVTSLIGLVALVGGLLVLFAASHAALGVVMAAMAVLWVMATVRHSLIPGTPVSPSGSALDAARPEPESASTR